MSRRSGDPTVIPSSIALLQERFRQLQRAKEMREERELLRLFPSSEAVNHATFNRTSKLLTTPESILSVRPPPQASLSHPADSQSKHPDMIQVIEAPTSANLRHMDMVAHQSHDPEDSEVDTSLHL